MNDNLILLCEAEKAASFSGTIGESCTAPAACFRLLHDGAYRAGDQLCVFSGTVYTYADPDLPRTCPEAYLCASRQKYGDRFLETLEGKFVFALADLREQSLLLARDHYGGYPLFWCCGEDFIAASGKLSPLANSGLVKKELSRAGLCDLFTLRFIPAPDTIFENIHALMPGHFVSARLEGSRVTVCDRCWWDVDCRSENMEHDYESCKRRLREAVIEAVDTRCFPGQNGVFLSGGIDSTIVTGIASTLLGRSIDSFTIGFREKEFDESPRAKIASDTHHSRPHVFFLDYEDALADLESIIGGFDQPFADDSAIPTWAINHFAAAEGFENVLTGDGSDQVFAGANKYFIRYYVDKLMKVPAPLRKAAKAAVFALPDNNSRMRKIRKVFSCADMSPDQMRRRMSQICLGDEELAKLLMGRTVDKSTDTAARLYALNRGVTDDLTNTLYVDLKFIAEADMTKMGCMSRLAGVNTHMPLAAKSVLETAFRIPPEFKTRGGSGKLILKDAFADLIPPELMTASKKGFMPPVAAWFRGPLLSELRRELAPERMEAIGLFDPAFVTQLIDEHVSLAYDRSVVLWALYVFTKWYAKEFE